MYNRYVPQPDGSYRRNRVSDPPPPVKHPPHQPHTPPPQPKEEVCVNTLPPQPSASMRPLPPSRTKRKPENVSSFFRNLLPRDLDTEDLLIIVLLLLMSGDCKEDQSTALLTLALYLFM